MKGIWIWIMGVTLAITTGCGNRHAEVARQLEELKTGSTETYPVAYAAATYLSTATTLSPEEALPIALELISLKYYTEARYAIDNLFRNGIYSEDLLALRGLCYFNELQPELAKADLDRALERDPDNDKIRTLWNQVHGKSGNAESWETRTNRAREHLIKGEWGASEEILDGILTEEPLHHSALYLKGWIQLEQQQYDSALYFMQFARSVEEREEYAQAVKALEQVTDAESIISGNPASFNGYLQKSRGLASLGAFQLAHRELDRGLEQLPENRNLLLAKALVWVQAGDRETAERYLQELELRGVVLSRELKSQILQTPSQ